MLVAPLKFLSLSFRQFSSPAARSSCGHQLLYAADAKCSRSSRSICNFAQLKYSDRFHKLPANRPLTPFSTLVSFSTFQQPFTPRLTLSTSSDGKKEERKSSSSQNTQKATTIRERNRSMTLWLVAIALLLLALSYLAVPLYTMICQATGIGGTVKDNKYAKHSTSDSKDRFKPINENETREIAVRFMATVSEDLGWEFKPVQNEVKVLPGETVLASYLATNKTDKPMIGISTYNVVPMKAAQYFNKIQCFCFEEQKLAPKETVELPVFFYLDPAMLNDRELRGVERVTLSYIFHRSQDNPATLNVSVVDPSTSK